MKKELYQAWVDDYLARLAEQAAAEGLSPRLRTPVPAADIDTFFRLVGTAITKQQEIDGAVIKLQYSEEFPEKDDNIDGEVITYNILSRKPGTFENQKVSQAMSDRNIRQRTKIFREAYADPDNPGSRIYTFGQWFDNLVEFDMCARTNKTANKRALWFEDFMETWAWYFKANGVLDIRFEERGADAISAPENRKLAIRPMTYLVRTEKITVIREHTLRSLIVASSLD